MPIGTGRPRLHCRSFLGAQPTPMGMARRPGPLLAGHRAAFERPLWVRSARSASYRVGPLWRCKRTCAGEKSLQTNAAQGGIGHHKLGSSKQKCRTRAHTWLRDGTHQRENLRTRKPFYGNRTVGSNPPEPRTGDDARGLLRITVADRD